MSIQEVEDFIKKTRGKREFGGIKFKHKTLKQCLVDLQVYINATISEIVGQNSYDEKTVCDWIYKDGVSEDEKDEFVKVNLFAARNSLGRIIEMISITKNGLTYSNILPYRYLLQDFLHDINYFINFFKQKKDSDYIFCSGGKNYSTTSVETFMLAKNFFGSR